MIYILLIFSTLYGYRTPLVNKVNPRCYDENYVRAWVYFTDKNVEIDDYQKAIEVVRSKLNTASLERRLLRRGVIDYADLPLSQDYIDEIEAREGLLMKESKWLNAASFWIAKEDLDNIAELDFVYKITKVASFRSPGETEIALQDTTGFGIAYQQLKMFNIDKVQDKGIFGSNVKVGILDTGLRKKHIALNNITVLAEHDFLGGDQIFFDNAPVTEQYGVYSDILFHKTSSRLNLFVTRDTTLNYLPVRDVLYTYSTDNGNSWSLLSNITNNSIGNWSRELEICGRDTMFIFHRDRYGIKYILYTDAILGSGSLTGTSFREPSAVQIDDTVYVVYGRKDTLYLQKGDVSGFGPAMIIDTSISNIKAPETVMGIGKIGVFYHILPQDSIFFLSSSIPASETSFTKQYFGQGKDATSISYGDTLLCIWKDASNDPLFTVAFAKSTDFCNSPIQPIYLSDDLNAIGKISIEKFSYKVTVAWETEGKIYFKNSYDNGISFGSLDSLNKEFTYLPTLATTDADIIKIHCERGDSITDGYASTDPEHFHPRHGTEMLGLIGGYLNGHYVGVAPGAQFLVAKTENPDSSYEFPVEEDTWVTGLE